VRPRDPRRGRADIRTVSQAEFLAKARASLARPNALALVAATHRLLGADAQRGADLFLHTGRRFPCRALASLGHAIPEPDAALLLRYVDEATTERAAAE
jgi:hypothetical protein